MSDDSKTPSGSKLAIGMGAFELALVVFGLVLLGASYSPGLHTLLVLVLGPIVLYFVWRWASQG